MWRAKEAESTHMTPQKTTIAILAALTVSLTLAEDFKTVSGRVYKTPRLVASKPTGLCLELKPEFQRSISLNFLKTFRNGFIMVLRRQLERQARNASARPKAPNPPPQSSMARLPSISLRNEFQRARGARSDITGETHTRPGRDGDLA